MCIIYFLIYKLGGTVSLLCLHQGWPIVYEFSPTEIMTYK